MDLFRGAADERAAFFAAGSCLARRAAIKSSRVPSKLLSPSSSPLEISTVGVKGLRRALLGEVIPALDRFAFAT